MALDIHMRVPPCAPAPEVAAFLTRCERAGLAGVGIVDSQLLLRDPFVTMAAAARATTTLRMATAVANPVTRHPSVLASAAKSVAEMAPGRVSVWIGRGYSAVRTIGVPAGSTARMREAVESIRALTSGDSVTFKEHVTSRMHHGGGDRVPVYIAATGPRTIRLAGEVADGLLLHVGVHPAFLAKALELLEEGASNAGRSLSDIDVIMAGSLILDDDLDAARERLRPMCVQRLVEPHHARWYGQLGITIDDYEVPQELWELYPDIPHAEDWEKARRATSFLPEDALAMMCDAMGLIGPVEHCIRRLKDAEAAGIKRLYLMPVGTYELPVRELEALERHIMPALRG